MGTKVTRTTTWTETDGAGNTVSVKKEQTCGPVCKTVKVVAAVGLIALLVGALSKR